MNSEPPSSQPSRPRNSQRLGAAHGAREGHDRRAGDDGGHQAQQRRCRADRAGPSASDRVQVRRDRDAAASRPQAHRRRPGRSAPRRRPSSTAAPSVDESPRNRNGQAVASSRRSAHAGTTATPSATATTTSRRRVERRDSDASARSVLAFTSWPSTAPEVILSRGRLTPCSRSAHHPDGGSPHARGGDGRASVADGAVAGRADELGVLREHAARVLGRAAASSPPGAPRARPRRPAGRACGRRRRAGSGRRRARTRSGRRRPPRARRGRRTGRSCRRRSGRR